MQLAGVPRRKCSLGPRGPSWLPKMAMAVPVVFWAASLLLAIIYRTPRGTLFGTLAGEDGPIEIAQTAVLLGCVLLSVSIAFALHRRNSPVLSVMYCGLAVGALWAAGEEISWGQRAFGFGTPEWLAHNLQGEANLHNLPGVNGTLGTIVEIALWAMIVLSLVTSYWRPSRTVRWQTEFWIPPPILIPAWLCYLSYSWIRTLDLWWYQQDVVHSIVSKLQEPAELILYGGVLAFLTMIWLRVRRLEPSARTAAE